VKGAAITGKVSPAKVINQDKNEVWFCVFPGTGNEDCRDKNKDKK